MKDHRDRMWRRICERLEGSIYVLDDNQAENQLLGWVHRDAFRLRRGQGQMSAFAFKDSGYFAEVSNSEALCNNEANVVKNSLFKARICDFKAHEPSRASQETR